MGCAAHPSPQSGCTRRCRRCEPCWEYAQHQVGVAEAGVDGTCAGWGRLHRAEQILLLARLAADSGARRGELAALQVDDLDGDVLTIAAAPQVRSRAPPRPGGSAA